MDNFVKEILTKWKMESLIPSFEENEIDEESFHLLDDQIIVHIIPKPGPRLKFIKNFKVFSNQSSFINTDYKILSTANDSVILDELIELNKENVSIEHEQDNSMEIANNSLDNSGKANDEILESSEKRLKPYEPFPNSIFPGGFRKYLDSTADGKLILSNEDKIDEKVRCHIAKCVIDHLLLHFLVDGNTISKNTFLQAREEVVHAFPQESKETYFVPYKSATKTTPRTLNCGKLWTRFNNYKKSLGKDSTKDNESSKNTSLILTPENSTDINASIQFLRCNLEPFEDIVEHWTKTYTHRDTVLHQQSIADYFKEFPILKTQNGYKLLLSDFERKHDASTSQKLYSRWEDLVKSTCLNLVERKILNEDLITFENRDAIALNYFTYLFPQTTIGGKAKDERKKNWRPSRLERQKSFFLHLDIEGDYAEEIDKRQTKLLKYGDTIQPFIVCIGELKSPSRIYVVINDQKYVMESVVKALDTCFKCIFALHACYSSESLPIWSFLQRHVYDIRDQNEKNYSGIYSVLTDLKKTGFK